MRIFIFLHLFVFAAFSAVARAEIYDRSDVIEIQSNITKGETPSEDDIKQFTINPERVKITFVEEGTLPSPMWQQRTKGGGDANKGLTPEQVNARLNAINDTLDKVANITEKVWGMVKDGKSALNVETKYASAVPRAATHWTDLTGWDKAPWYTKYTIEYENLYGFTVVKFDIRVQWIANGSFQGKGKYLTGVGASLHNVYVAWGYKLDAFAEVPDSTIINMGSAENPIALLQLIVKYRTWTFIKSHYITDTFIIDGRGKMEFVRR